MKPYWALFKSNLRLTLRDRSVIFFNYLFPFIFFFAFAELFHAGTGAGIAYFVGTVLTMGILGNGLWGAGMRAVQDREANILRRYKVTPIGPLPILLAAMVSGWLLYLPVVVVLLAVAHFQYAMPLPRNWISLFFMVSLGVCAFRSIGLILASVTNTMQEAMIAIQLFYMPMLFLSGATIPAAMLPKWAQTAAEFMPASYLVTGFQGIFFRNQTLFDNRIPVGALLLTIFMGTFLATQLFRWEKEEKIPGRNRLWVLAVLGPFVLMGCYRAYSKEHLGQNQAMYRDLQRAGTFLIRNARIFVGDGKVIESGAVLVRDGRIGQVFEGPSPDPEAIHADPVEGAGKTLLPGLIDLQVRLARPAAEEPDLPKAMTHSAAALLYSGVTAARTSDEALDATRKLNAEIAGGSKLGATLFFCGPAFSAAGTAGDPAPQVRQLKAAGATCVQAILESDSQNFSAVAAEARAQGLPLAVRTAGSRDVAAALEAGAASIERGSWRDPLPDDLLQKMARQGVSLCPTLAWFAGDPGGLNRSLVQQTISIEVLKTTRQFLASGKPAGAGEAALAQAKDNLRRAWKAGVPLVIGTAAGAPMVFHGPSLHRELQLWVEAGIPAAVALQAATGQAAKLLHADTHFGSIRKGLDANLLLVDGNPLEEIAATERISLVVFRGERVRRATLFEK